MIFLMKGPTYPAGTLLSHPKHKQTRNKCVQMQLEKLQL